MGSSNAAGEAGRLLLATDWSATPLGPMDRWPQALRIAASICLNSRFPMFVWWGPDAINIYNDAYIPMLGKRHPAAFGKPAHDSWSDIWAVVGAQHKAVMDTGEPTWNERVLLVMERNGFPEDTWFTWSYSPIHDDDGGIGGMFCAVTEETGRVLAERERDRLMREAQDAARTLRTWFDNAPGFVGLLRGPDFVFELVNEAYRQLVAHRRLEGLALLDALPELTSQGYFELLQQVYESGEPFVGRGARVVLQQAPGAAPEERFVDFLYQPVRDGSGAVVGIFVQGHDVTDQVQAAAALEEANQRKDEFLATLAHELRNPLAPIRQAARLARTSPDPQQQQWALNVVERQVGHMALLLDDLLDVSRISRGKLELRLAAVDLKAVVDSAVEMAAPLIESGGHRLDVQLPDHPVQLTVDPVRIAQVLTNLLSNAAKYTDPGGRIRLSAEEDGGWLRLRVRDNGIGLSPEHVDAIFGMFSQVTAAAERAQGGLGIGLALSRGLAALHGGSLEARSEGPGRGSEFTVSLPLPLPARASEPAAPAGEMAPAAASDAAHPRRILIADDNADALTTMTLLLEMEGHEVHGAADGEQALARAEALRPDIVILDIGMPRLSGHEVATRIRATEWGQHARLIALTGWGQAHDQERARAAGFDHHCTKPVDLGELLALLGPRP
ncbi:response regulator [Ramlibacter sp. G-1-2-2]|uniref:histidine kinase n=1 Tax=Ramlibacter agri TaxID=2728837 RepID=A0A848HGI4_9BURK|nr:ATP-binding protein [Ramlibacter agri]NML46768.1 response regulator [Ramlibacter agri]